MKTHRKMDDKLAEYRRKKAKQFEKTKLITSSFGSGSSSSSSYLNYLPFYPLICKILNYLASTPSAQYIAHKWRKVPLLGRVNVLCWVLWALGYLIALEIEFGIVYLTSSMIGLIFLNLGTKKEGEISAYSVFNPGCRRLDGTFSSDDFEKNVLHRQ